MAFRKGYVTDHASLSMKAGDNYLKYMQNHKLIHVSGAKVEVYSFWVNENMYPPRIIVQSTDSIEIPVMKKDF